MPPRPAGDALINLVIPNYRGDRQNFRVTNVQPVPNLCQIFDEAPPQQGESLMARVEYSERGRAIEEEFYGVYAWNQTDQLNWGFGRLFCFRAERGQLDALRETFWQIAASLERNPQWNQLHDETLQRLNGTFMAGIDDYYDVQLKGEQAAVAQNIENNAQINAWRNAHVNALIEQTRQENYERSQYHYTPQEAFGDALMNRTPYEDPNSTAGNHFYVEGNPLYVKTDGRGNFRTSNDPTYNPGDYEDGDWFDATPIKPGR
jgi:subtilisin family serine protease